MSDGMDRFVIGVLWLYVASLLMWPDKKSRPILAVVAVSFAAVNLVVFAFLWIAP